MEKRFSDMIQVSAKGSMILVIGQMASTLISALGTIIIARMLGSISFGVISIAQIPVSLVLLFVNNGVDNAIIHYLAVYREDGRMREIRSIITAGFLVNFIIGFTTTIILYFFSGYLAQVIFKENELEILIKILAISVLSTSVLNTSMSVLVGFEKMTSRSILSIINSIMKSIIGPLLVFIGLGVTGVALGTSLPIVIVSILGTIFSWVYTRNLPSASSSSILLHIKLITSYAYPLFLSNILAGGMNQLFTFILPIYVTSGVMGNYSAATTFSVLVNFFMTPINTATFPLLSKLKPEDSVFEFVFQSIIKYTSLIVFPIAAFTIALSKQLVLVLYGPDYSLAPLYLRLYMLNYFFIGLGSLTTISLLNSQKETRINLTRTLIASIIAIPAGFFLIPRYGVLGYLITALFIPKIGLFFTITWIKKNYGFIPDLKVFTLTLAAVLISGLSALAVSILLVSNLWVEIMISGGVFLLVYIIAILFLGVITKRNLQDIHILLEKYDKLLPIIDHIYSVLFRLAKK